MQGQVAVVGFPSQRSPFLCRQQVQELDSVQLVQPQPVVPPLAVALALAPLALRALTSLCFPGTCE
eukprot:2972601-Rhodomonas_salina.1